MVYGYARVSTREQNEERQLIALREYVEKECRGEGIRIYVDKQSGKDFERCHYKELLCAMEAGDLLVVKSIDRLGRDYVEILEQWRIITKDKGCDIVIIDMPILNTSKNKDLIGTLISDIVLQLLSYVAETERAFIRQRVIEGIVAAKARGVKFGRHPAVKPENYENVLSQYRCGGLTSRQAGSLLGVSHVTFLKWYKQECFY